MLLTYHNNNHFGSIYDKKFNSEAIIQRSHLKDSKSDKSVSKLNIKCQRNTFNN